MASFLKGRNVRVEVATAYAAADTVTAITNANPGVATSTGHGQTNGTVGYFSTVVGMDEIDGQAYRAANVAANTFETEGLDTSTFGTFTSGSAIAVSTWATLTHSTSYTIGGGDATQLNTTTLLDKITQQENGMLAAQTVSIDGFVPEGGNTSMDTLEAAAFANGYVVFRITHPNGDVRVFRGQVSLPGESVSVDQLATAGFSCTVKGRVMKL
jgi:Phage tail tube protein, TTP